MEFISVGLHLISDVKIVSAAVISFISNAEDCKSNKIIFIQGSYKTWMSLNVLEFEN